jgi:hypothetical protein
MWDGMIFLCQTPALYPGTASIAPETVNRAALLYKGKALAVP